MMDFKRIARGLLYQPAIRPYYEWLHEKLTRQIYLDPIYIDFYKQFLEPGDLCFDIGAHTGQKVWSFLKIGCRVVAVEPQPVCARVIELKFGNRVTLIKKAVSDKAGSSSIHTGDSLTTASLDKGYIDTITNTHRIGEGIKHNHIIQVETVTLDSLISQFGIPKFIKIDVEGHELNVLKGLTQPVNYISFEFTIPEFTDRTIQCIQYLNSLGRMECNLIRSNEVEFLLKDWNSPEEMIQYISQNENSISYGDIYVKYVA